MKVFLYIASLSIFWGLGPDVYGQSSSDSLSLTQVMQTVIQSHPSIKEAEEAISAADARIELAKSAYLPNVDANASYSRVGPVPTLPFPLPDRIDNSDPGNPKLVFKSLNFQLFPADNFAGSINYNQVLYDFGKTKSIVGLESENKILAGKYVDMAKQRLSLLTANTFYALVYLQEAIKIKDKELTTLKEHLEFVEKKKATGSATQYEYLTTKVKISSTESQKLDLETMHKVQQSSLKSLMGLPVTTDPTVKMELSVSLPSVSQDSLLSYAYNHRLEMALSKEKETIAGLQYKMTKSQNNPMLNVFASGGGKNGYVPDLGVVKANFVAGVSLKVPLFDGNRMKYNLQLSKSAENNTLFDTEIARRNITNEVVEGEANRIAALQKITQNEIQVSQAEEAFGLAKVNYSNGVITNLDLLDAENVVSESRLLLLKSRIDYITSIFRLNISLGNKMY